MNQHVGHARAPGESQPVWENALPQSSLSHLLHASQRIKTNLLGFHRNSLLVSKFNCSFCREGLGCFGHWSSCSAVLQWVLSGLELGCGFWWSSLYIAPILGPAVKSHLKRWSFTALCFIGKNNYWSAGNVSTLLICIDLGEFVSSPSSEIHFQDSVVPPLWLFQSSWCWSCAFLFSNLPQWAFVGPQQSLPGHEWVPQKGQSLPDHEGAAHMISGNVYHVENVLLASVACDHRAVMCQPFH